MEMNEYKKLRTVNSIILIVSLAGTTVGLGVLVWLTARGAAQAEGDLRRYLARLAWLALALMSITSVLLMWVVIRLISSKLFVRENRSPTPYVDAWSLAGQRLKLPPDQEGDEDKDSQEGGEN